jgi:hypothetical protein
MNYDLPGRMMTLPIVRVRGITLGAPIKADFVGIEIRGPATLILIVMLLNLGARLVARISSPQARPLRRGEQPKEPRGQRIEVNDQTLMATESSGAVEDVTRPLNLAPSPLSGTSAEESTFLPHPEPHARGDSRCPSG